MSEDKVDVLENILWTLFGSAVGFLLAAIQLRPSLQIVEGGSSRVRLDDGTEVQQYTYVFRNVPKFFGIAVDRHTAGIRSALLYDDQGKVFGNPMWVDNGEDATFGTVIEPGEQSRLSVLMTLTDGSGRYFVGQGNKVSRMLVPSELRNGAGKFKLLLKDSRDRMYWFKMLVDGGSEAVFPETPVARGRRFFKRVRLWLHNRRTKA